jgi:hypothetical protein
MSLVLLLNLMSFLEVFDESGDCHDQRYDSDYSAAARAVAGFLPRLAVRLLAARRSGLRMKPA